MLSEGRHWDSELSAAHNVSVCLQMEDRKLVCYQREDGDLVYDQRERSNSMCYHYQREGSVSQCIIRGKTVAEWASQFTMRGRVVSQCTIRLAQGRQWLNQCTIWGKTSECALCVLTEGKQRVSMLSAWSVSVCWQRENRESACCQFEVCLCAVGGKTESQHAVSWKCVCVLLEGKLRVSMLSAWSVSVCCQRENRESLCCQLEVSVCCQRESQCVLLSPLFPANSALVNTTY